MLNKTQTQTQARRLGDDHVMHLIQSSKPLLKSNSTYVNWRIYSEENLQLKACFNTTEWKNLLNAEGNIHVDDKADMITNYINFFTNLCIPL